MESGICDKQCHQLEIMEDEECHCNCLEEQVVRQIDRHTDRQKDRQINRQTDRQTDRLTDKQWHQLEIMEDEIEECHCNCLEEQVDRQIDGQTDR